MKAPQFLETICYENGGYPLLEYHQQRLNKTFAVHFPGHEPPSLEEYLPNITFAERHKVRVVYDQENIMVEFSAYQVRPLHKIKLISCDIIDYSFKYQDRSELQALFDQRGDADEILIVKRGSITDSFYANIALWDGNQWFTPTSYLLNGVRRQSLISSGALTETEIKRSDIFKYEKVSLINAMLDLGEAELSISQIID